MSLLARVGPKRTTSIFVALILLLSAVVVAIPFAAPAEASTGLLQSTAGSCASCTSLSLTFPNPVQSGDAVAATVCWSGGVSGVSFSDSSLIDQYQEVASATNTVQCDGAWTRAAVTGVTTVTVSWTGSESAIFNIYEAAGNPSIINPYRTSGKGTGNSFSLPFSSAGTGAVAIACYGTTSAVTLTAGTSFTLDGSSGTGGCEHAVNLASLGNFPMTSSSSVAWAGIALVVQASQGITQCAGSTSTTLSCTTADSTNQVGVGDMLVVTASRTDVGGTWTISDNMSDVWTPVASVANTAKAQVWYAVADEFGHDKVTVDFSDTSTLPVTLTVMDCGPECTNQSITYSTGTGIGTSFTVPSQTMAIGPGLAVVASTSSPGAMTGGSGYYALPSTASGDVESSVFASRTGNTCSSLGTNSVRWAEICVSVRAGIVETVNLENGPFTAPISPSNYFTASYRLDGVARTQSVGPSTTTWVDDQADADSLSPTSSLSTPTQQWVLLFSAGAPASQTWSSGSAAQGVTESYVYYQQYRNSLKITPLSPATWDASRTIEVDGVQAGVASVIATLTPASGSGVQSVPVWTDGGQFVVWQASTGGGAGSTWIPNPIDSSPVTSGGGTVNSNYTLQATVSTTTATTTVTTASLTITETSTVTTPSVSTATQTQTATSTETVTSNTAVPTTTTTTTTTTQPPTTTTSTTVTKTTTTTSVSSSTTTVTSTIASTSVTTTLTHTTTSSATTTATTTSFEPTTTTTVQTVTSSVSTTKTVTSAQSSTTTITTRTTLTSTTISTSTSFAKTASTTTLLETSFVPTTVEATVTSTTSTTRPTTTTVTSTATVTTTQSASSTAEWAYIITIPLLVILLVLAILSLRRRSGRLRTGYVPPG